MTHEQMILLEQFLRFDNISFEDGIEYLKFILNMRDFRNPLYKSGEHEKTELVIMDFKQETGSVYFSGAFTLINRVGAPENRSITGNIYREKGRTIIEMDVYRHVDSEEADKEYNVVEMFTPSSRGFKTFTSYRSNNETKNYIDTCSIDTSYLEEFVKEKTRIPKKGM